MRQQPLIFGSCGPRPRAEEADARNLSVLMLLGAPTRGETGVSQAGGGRGIGRGTVAVAEWAADLLEDDFL